jgi:lysozyme
LSFQASHITATSPRGLAWLACLEGGHRLHAYRDVVGVWTIGAGLTRYAALWPERTDRRVREGDVVALEAARAEFAAVVSRFAADVDAVTRDTLAQFQFDAVVSFAYSVGSQALRTSTLLSWVNEARDPSDVALQFKRWHYANGMSVPGLRLRRDREAEVYAGGDYRDQGGRIIVAPAEGGS